MNLQWRIKLTNHSKEALLAAALCLCSTSLGQDKIVEFAQTSITVAEGARVVLPLHFDPAPQQPIELTFSLIAGSRSQPDWASHCFAREGSPGSVVLRVPSEFPCIGFPFDGVVEGDETLEFSLSSPTAGYLIGPRSNLTVHLVDMPVEISASADPPKEGAVDWAVQLRRRGDTSSAVTVDYSLRRDSGVEAADFREQQGTLLLSAGEIEKRFALSNPVVDNTRPDGPRAFRLTLTSATPGVRLEQESLQVPILDNEIANSFDPTFQAVRGSETRRVILLCAQSDGKLIVQAIFTYFIGDPDDPEAEGDSKILRLHPDGTPDPDFVVTPVLAKPPQSWWNTPAISWHELPDGKHLVFREDFDLPVRLNPDGSLDKDFRIEPELAGKYRLLPPFLPLEDGNWIARLEDRDGLIAGSALVRLNSDGTRDEGFAPIQLTPASTQPLVALHPAGILVLNGFLNRFDLAGKPDQTFHGVPDPGISHIVVQPDEKILLLGEFESIAGEQRTNFVRLLPDGSIDRAFDPIPPYPHPGLLLLPDNRILAVASELGSPYSPYPVPSLICYKPDGSLDRYFPLGVDGSLIRLHPLPDGRVLLAGRFGNNERGISVPSHLTGLESVGIAAFNLSRTETPSFEVVPNTDRFFPDGRLDLLESDSSNAEAVILRVGHTAELLVLEVSASGNATLDKDFKLHDVAVNLLPGEVRKRVRFEILDDRIPEIDEEFSISIAATPDTVNSVHRVRILDDDPGLMFTRSPQLTSFPDGSTVIELHFTAPPDENWFIEASDDLMNWTRKEIYIEQQLNGTRRAVLDWEAVKHPRRFYRAVKE